MRYNKDFNLKKYNSFKLESYAKEIYFPETITDLQAVLVLLRNKKFKILAGGTNVILRPEIDCVLSLDKMPQKINFYDGATIVTARVPTISFILEAIKNNIIGIEGLIGIPGTIGGAIVMNAGSGKYTISDYLLAVTTMNLEGNIRVYQSPDLEFGRRYSILQEKKEILIDAVFDFKHGFPNQEEIDKAKAHRKTIPHYPSAGGIFKNWHSLKPYAEKLIGLRVGDAEVSESINIIVNKKNATFEDIMTLIEKISYIVRKPLELEVKIL